MHEYHRRGVFLGMRAVVGEMSTAAGGSLLVNILSIAGRDGDNMCAGICWANWSAEGGGDAGHLFGVGR